MLGEMTRLVGSEHSISVSGLSDVTQILDDIENSRLRDVEFVEAFGEVVSLEEIKATPALGGMALVNRARLSVQSVSKEEFQLLRKMGRKKK